MKRGKEGIVKAEKWKRKRRFAEISSFQFFLKGKSDIPEKDAQTQWWIQGG